jgi:glycosyltransferase involved in cell wall biosynthesis
MTFVSVVIPAYNHANYLRTAIESVLAQTWSDFEIVVVDDGSPDHTPTVAAEFGNRIQYIRQPNQGMAAARNRGIHHSSGGLISFLDDDDLWMPDYLATVVPRFESDSNLAALHTGCQLTSDTEGVDLPQAGTRTVPADQLYDELLINGFFPPSSVTVRRTCLESVGVFDENLQGLADWELWLRISRRYKFAGIPDILVRYRIHSGGLSSNVKHMTEDRLRAVQKHFGPPTGSTETWGKSKRKAYAYAYRNAAIEYLMHKQNDDAWRWMKEAILCWPGILDRLDTFYELVCGDQSRGYRGIINTLNLPESGTEMINRLDVLFKSEPHLRAWRSAAYGNAYVALAVLSDQRGQWACARSYLVRAVVTNPRLAGSASLIRRLLKLTAGKRIVSLFDPRRLAR